MEFDVKRTVAAVSHSYRESGLQYFSRPLRRPPRRRHDSSPPPPRPRPLPQPWKKETQYYCEYCNAWMANNIQTKTVHEGGMKHKENVAKSES